MEKRSSVGGTTPVNFRGTKGSGTRRVAGMIGDTRRPPGADRTRSEPDVRRNPLSDDAKNLGAGGEAPPGGAVTRRFTDDEVRRILHNAAELQEDSSSAHADSGRGMTLSDLRQIAEEAGIDARFIDIAASTEGTPTRTTEVQFAGAPMNWHFTQSVDGTLEDTDFQRVLMTIRSVMKEKGELAEVFGRMEWSYNDGVGPVIVGVASRDGRTEIDVTASRSGEAGLYFGLIIPFGGLLGGAVLSSILGLKGAAALPLIGLSAGVNYVAMRMLWKARSKWWTRRLRSVVEKVAATISESTGRLGGAAQQGLPAGPSDEARSDRAAGDDGDS